MGNRVLVTGATGFVGNVLCETLAAAGFIVRGAVRTSRTMPASVSECVTVGEIGAATSWEAALQGVDHVIHLAARVHVMKDDPANLDLYTETNLRGTRCLAAAAARADVQRFIYVSSVKVNGEETSGHPYSAADEPLPQDPYGVSKLHAERCVQEMAAQSAMRYTIVRPPLVYGPGVRANFLRLMRWIDEERPLPLGAIANRRSMVSVWNLSDLLLNLLANPAAVGRTLMVSDGLDFSTPELIRRIAHAMGRRERLLSVPVSMLKLLGAVSGKRAEIARLCGSLCVDLAETRAAVGWLPPVSVEVALERTVRWYLAASW